MSASDEAVERLIFATGALIKATDGMENIRPERKAALEAMEGAANYIHAMEAEDWAEMSVAIRRAIDALTNHTAAMKEALEGLLNRYVGLVNSGDAGFWNPEEEDEVKAARAALSSAPLEGRK